jgi:DNA-binding transcriptional regulator LsrR (DeoR family)
MFKHEGEGVISYSNRQLADIINMPESTVRKNLTSLINKGYVEIKEVKDEFTGLVTKQKIYHLNKLEQAIIFILKNHEDRIKENENRLDDYELKLAEQAKEIEELKKLLQQ